MSRCVEIKQLPKTSHCMICSKEIAAKDEFILRIDPYMSKAVKINVCFDCIDYMNNLKNSHIEKVK